MKKILFIISTLCYISGSAQLDTANFKVESKMIYWEKVYDVPNKNASEIKSLLVNKLSALQKTDDFKYSDDIITLSINGVEYNYKDYGFKWGNTPVLLLHYQYGKVRILWKGEKYKVTITDMYASTNDQSAKVAAKGSNLGGRGWLLNYNIFLLKKGKLDLSKNNAKLYTVIDGELSKLFDVAIASKNDNW